MICPLCGHEIERLQVNGETVIEIEDTWLEYREHWKDRVSVTEQVAFVYIKGEQHEDRQAVEERGAGMEQLETGKRSQRLVSIRQANPSHAGHRRQTHEELRRD